MNTLKSLIELQQNGELGKLLASKFNGVRGRVYPNEDSDLLVAFPSDNETPDSEKIAEVVTEYLKGKGYFVEKTDYSNDIFFEALVYVDERKQEKLLHVLVTTKYPGVPPSRNNYLRLTTQFI